MSSRRQPISPFLLFPPHRSSFLIASKKTSRVSPPRLDSSLRFPSVYTSSPARSAPSAPKSDSLPAFSSPFYLVLLTISSFFPLCRTRGSPYYARPPHSFFQIWLSSPSEEVRILPFVVRRMCFSECRVVLFPRYTSLKSSREGLRSLPCFLIREGNIFCSQVVPPCLPSSTLRM